MLSDFRLYLENFKSTKEFELDLKKPGLTLICGPNGAGKTTIADGISFVLLNRSVSGKKGSELLSTLHSGPLTAELEFRTAKAQFLVRRCVSEKGATSVSIFEDGKPLEFATIHHANAYLQSICSKNMFFNAMFFSKSAGTFFLKLRDKDKKRFMEGLLELLVFEVAEAMTKERSKRLEERLQAVQRDREVFKQAAEKKRVDLGKSEIQIDGQLTELMERIRLANEEEAIIQAWLVAADIQTPEIAKLRLEEQSAESEYLKSTQAIEAVEKLLHAREAELRSEFSGLRAEKLDQLQQNTAERDALNTEYQRLITEVANKLDKQLTDERVSVQALLQKLETELAATFRERFDAIDRAKLELSRDTAVAENILSEKSAAILKEFREDETALRKMLDGLRDAVSEKRNDIASELSKIATAIAEASSVKAGALEDIHRLQDDANVDRVCPLCTRPGMNEGVVQSVIRTKEAIVDAMTQAIATNTVAQRELEQELRGAQKRLQESTATTEQSLRELRAASDSEISKIDIERRELSTATAKKTAELDEALRELQLEKERLRSTRVHEIQAASEKTIQAIKESADSEKVRVTQTVTEKITSASSKIEELSRALADIEKNESTAILEDTKRLRLVKDLSERRLDSATSQSRLEELRKRVVELELAYGKTIRDEKTRTRTRILDDIARLTREMAEARDRKRIASETLIDWEKTESARLDAEEASVKAEKARLAFWVKGFGSDGIRHQFIKTVLPEFNRRLQKYSDELTDGNIFAELKYDGKKLVFHAVNTVKNSVFELFSAGEQAITALIFLLASSDVLSAFEKFESSLAIFDEVFDALDYYNSTVVFEALNRLAKRKRILLITHNELLKESELATEVIEMAS